MKVPGDLLIVNGAYAKAQYAKASQIAALPVCFEGSGTVAEMHIAGSLAKTTHKMAELIFLTQ